MGRSAEDCAKEQLSVQVFGFLVAFLVYGHLVKVASAFERRPNDQEQQIALRDNPRNRVVVVLQ